MLIEIDPLCLDKDSIARFKKIESKAKNCYQEALRSSPPLGLDYLPIVYPIPFVRKDVSIEPPELVFNAVFEDPLEEKHRAIFPSLPLLEVIEEKFVTANLAHELAHIRYLTLYPNGMKELIRKHKDNRRLLRQELEQRIEEIYKQFKEPVKSWLYELDEEANRIRDQVIKSGAEVREFKNYTQEFQQYLKYKIKIS